MNRRGFVGDVGFIVGVFLVIAIVFIIGARVLSDVDDKIQDSDFSNGSKNISSVLETRYTGLFDGIFAMVFGLLAVGLIVSVSMLGSRPEFFFITIVVSFFVIGAAALLSNAFNAFANSSIAATATTFTYIPLIMNNLVELTLFLVALLVVGLFVKARGVV